MASVRDARNDAIFGKQLTVHSQPPAMTDQHRATPEQLSMSVYPGDIAADPRKVANAINALSARIEALEAAQLEQAESGRFCTDAIVRLKADALEKLRLAQQKESFSERWWNGYVQALEHVLAMGHE
jgi:hypothetical protein